MKKYSTSLLLSLFLSISANAAVTFTFATQTGSANGPNGLPVVDTSGGAILNSTNSLFASIGYLKDVVNPTVDNTITGTLARFVPVDNTPIIPNLTSGSIPNVVPRNGLFNAQDYNSSTNVYPTGFQGKTAVVVIGNNSSILQSTAIAMFSFGAFAAPDQLGNNVQSFLLTSSSVPIFGTIRQVTVQPTSGSSFVNGVSLVAVPETSTTLLGALGALAMLRRRRR